MRACRLSLTVLTGHRSCACLLRAAKQSKSDLTPESTSPQNLPVSLLSAGGGGGELAATLGLS